MMARSHEAVGERAIRDGADDRTIVVSQETAAKSEKSDAHDNRCDHYIIQGYDCKARNWMAGVADRTVYFVRAQDLARLIFLPGTKCLIFRYMNSNRKLTTDTIYTLMIVAISLLKPLLRIRLFWIMHNIDRETIDHYRVLTRVRRTILSWRSEKIFVTDQLFKELHFPDDPKVEAISFGPKRGGTISQETLSELERLHERCDQIGLCLSAGGGKYVHNQRMARLQDMAASCGVRLGLVVSQTTDIEGEDVLRVNEPNIDETALIGLVDFIYRINDDVSMPFTLYAAATAGIPIVTSADYFTHQIVERYGIGFSEQAWFAADECDLEKVRGNMRAYIDRSNWSSLLAKLP